MWHNDFTEIINQNKEIRVHSISYHSLATIIDIFPRHEFESLAKD